QTTNTSHLSLHDALPIYLGAKPEEVEGLFREALQVDPGSEENARNFDMFLKSLEAHPAQPMAGWKPPLPREVDAQFVSDREDQLDRKSTRLNSSHVSISY